MRGDKTFAYDLVISGGAVNSRVVLLLRSIEAQPRWFSFVEIHPHLSLCMAQKVEGGSVLALGKLAALEDWVGGKKTHRGLGPATTQVAVARMTHWGKLSHRHPFSP